jgi:hypothetical protein
VITDIKTFEAEAMSLPVFQRATLAQHLLASLDEVDEQENERLWLEEAGRRYNAYKDGSLSSKDAFAAIADMREYL